ncbi:MAG: Dabb family protein [Acidobacteriota bacterium]|nr:Dabb family protein [Acidobacteriota bacterium]
MLTHIVVWKYKPEITEEQRAEHRRLLKNLVNFIPEIINLNVGADILDLPRSYDTGLVATFADRRALDIYTENAEHQKVAALGKEIAQHVVSVDFVD